MLLTRPIRWLLVLAYGGALALSTAGSDHGHDHEETAAEHLEHIVGQGPHLGTHVDSLPGHDEHHAADCLACLFHCHQVDLASAPALPSPPPASSPLQADHRLISSAGVLIHHVRGPPPLAV